RRNGYEQYITGSPSDAARLDDAGQAHRAADGLCATQQRAIGWADVCTDDGLWLDGQPRGQLWAVTACSSESGRVGEYTGGGATLRRGVSGIAARAAARGGGGSVV